MNSSDMVKVRLRVEELNSWHGHKQEGVWVKLIKALADKAIVEVCNIPFFSNVISMGDRIAVGLYDDEVVFQSVVERGGHSTYRIFIGSPRSFDLERLSILKKLGCDWERSEWGGGDLYAVDIPPESDFDEVYGVLKQGKLDGIWICDQGYVNHHEEKSPPA
jgi:hypothetical protein